MPASPALAPLLAWYTEHARALPWRAPDVDGWRVLVSEVMLQQTPVARVLPAYGAWVRRWPSPAALAQEPAGAAVRMWGRLGYPRRALRLHAAAVVIDRDHDGVVPPSYAQLLTLPGVGEYTAAAVTAFAYRRRAAVLDTNVRRVLVRLRDGYAFPPLSLTHAERAAAATVLPADAETSARWNVAVMELGALVCSATAPGCGHCPVAHLCAWRSRGYPPDSGPPRRAQPYGGTDRQCRGRILALLRDSDVPVTLEAVTTVWDDTPQRQRALASLLADGLLVRTGDTVALP